MKTKTINKIKINEKVYKKIFNIYIEEKINKALEKYNKFESEFKKILNNKWIKISNLDIYYVVKENNFIVIEKLKDKYNLEKTIINLKEFLIFYDGLIDCDNRNSLIDSLIESRKYILDKMNEINKNPLPYIRQNDLDEEKFLAYLKKIFDKNLDNSNDYQNRKSQWLAWKEDDDDELILEDMEEIELDEDIDIISVYKLKVHEKETLLETLISNEFIPEIFSDNNVYKEIMYNYKNKNIIFKNNSIILSAQCVNKIKAGRLHITINEEKNVLDEFEKFIKK